MPAPRQLPLALLHKPDYGRDAFLAGPSNREALALIERWPDWSTPVAVLSGPSGSGKTHLAHIWAERTGAIWLKTEALGSAVPANPAAGWGIVLEDVAAERVPEQGLFHLINAAKETGAGLLVTSRLPPTQWRVTLPDLRSRLRMAVPVTLQEPDEDVLRPVLVKLFADRQMIVEKSVVDFLLVRMERSLTAAVTLVEALDREALAAGRRITRPMAGRILAAGDGSAGEFADRQ
jgi:chromosomal replication initiation ATPase DnaA